MAMSKGEIILKHVDSGSIPAASITQADQLSCQRKDHSAAGAFAAICPCETVRVEKSSPPAAAPAAAAGGALPPAPVVTPISG